VAARPQAPIFAPAGTRNPLTRSGRHGNVEASRQRHGSAAAWVFWTGAVSGAMGAMGGGIMSSRALLLGSALAALAAVLPAGNALAANWVEENFYLSGPRYDGVLPPCDAQAALGKIASRFGDKEHAYWNSALKIAGFDQIREVAYRPWAANTIPRRFCSAIVRISDGSNRPLHYSIGEDTGMIGSTWGVEWCVVGLDRNWAYNPACTMAEP
jgi:hypothetical protein